MNVFQRLRVYLRQRYVYKHVKMDDIEKCPACGVVEQVRFEWSDAYQAVILICSRCGARWGRKPIVALDQWQLLPGEAQPKAITKLDDMMRRAGV